MTGRWYPRSIGSAGQRHARTPAFPPPARTVCYGRTMAGGFFSEVDGPIPFGGLDSPEPLSFKVYEPDRLVLGKRMEDHLRVAVCLWHFVQLARVRRLRGGDLRSALAGGRAEPMAAARDRSPPRSSSSTSSARRTSASTIATSRPRAAPSPRPAPTWTRWFPRSSLRWGGPEPSSCGARPTCSATRATRPARPPTPIPEVFAYAAAQVKLMLEATHRLGGANYVLWGGREGYETLLNTDLAREEDQLARFLTLVAEHKHRIGFTGTLLIEPKPQEPTKHQYDYDCATVAGFLARHGLTEEYRVNIEVNHATLAGHSFHHEVAARIAHGIFGSIDINRGDYQNGWDTDQFPNSVDELPWPCTRSCRPAVSRPAASTSTPSSAARAWIGPTCSTPTSAAWTRWPGRCSWPARPRRAADARAVPRGAVRGLGPATRRAILGGEHPRGPGGRRRRRRDRPATALGAPGVAREPRQPADLGRGAADADRRSPAPR